MPGKDGSGPQGRGPRTGRGFGNCQELDRKDVRGFAGGYGRARGQGQTQGQAQGFGGRRGCGCGCGRGRAMGGPGRGRDFR